jgi:branched-chain amino acid transport system permease protein
MIEPVQFVQSIIFGLIMGGIYALVAIGLALVFGVMNVINFAHGDFVMLAMYITYFLSIMLTLDPVLVPLLTMPLFFIFGIGVYFGTLHKIIKGPALSQIAVTVGLLVLLRNLTLALWRAEPKAIEYTAIAGNFYVGPFIFPMSRLISAIISVATLILLHLFLTRTKMGLAIRATADDSDAASLFGVNVRNVYAVTFGLGTALIALAGALIMTFQQVNPLSGLLFGLLSWVIVAMGGLGGVVGVFFSSVILAVAESIGITFWDPRAREIIIYLIFILVLWVRPTGLFGRR